MNHTVNGKSFQLKHKYDCISGKRNKNKYMEYQDNYRTQYGVFPELDLINKPFYAKWDDLYNMFCQLRKSGLYGALYFHDLNARYRKHLKKLYDLYSKEWAFLISIDLEYRSIFNEIPTMQPCEHIVNNLGYRMDDNGNYFEGTWQNEKFIYGLAYLADQQTFFVGSFDESGKSTCNGVAINLGEDDKKKRQISTIAGSFRFNNGEISLYDSIFIHNIATIKNDEFLSLESFVGKYIDGYAEGTVINKELSDDIRIRWDKYRDGEIKSSMSSIELLPRTLIMFYMLIWYLVKYVYGSVFFITPLYYYFRKKNWKI